MRSEKRVQTHQPRCAGPAQERQSLASDPSLDKAGTHVPCRASQVPLQHPAGDREGRVCLLRHTEPLSEFALLKGQGQAVSNLKDQDAQDAALLRA